MKITQVKIRKTFSDSGRLKALVSISLDDEPAIHDIKIIELGNKMIAAMPSRKSNDGSYQDITHPIGAAMREQIHNEVISAYIRHLEDCYG